MKVVFDLDGTITLHPAACEAMAAAFTGMGHTVAVLTGHAGNEYTEEQRNKVRDTKRDVLWEIGFMSYGELVVCFGENSRKVASLKAGWIKNNGAHVFIDDSILYCDEVKKACPGVLVLHVHEVGR